MATLTIINEQQTLTDSQEIARYLARLDIAYERWNPSPALAPGASSEEILRAYERDIEALKARGGYLTADVINVDSQTAGLEEMLNKFNREHWHDEDEVRFIVEGHGIFHIRPQAGSVVAIEVSAGDLLCVPRGTLHWFNLCPDMRIKAIRLFQDSAGWTPYYTDELAHSSV
jgi:1,2-dihydroxy-3-keto-5-methylthiopentene dioxygenase